jgi:hypothetical protein
MNPFFFPFAGARPPPQRQHPPLGPLITRDHRMMSSDSTGGGGSEGPLTGTHSSVGNDSLSLGGTASSSGLAAVASGIGQMAMGVDSQEDHHSHTSSATASSARPVPPLAFPLLPASSADGGAGEDGLLKWERFRSETKGMTLSLRSPAAGETAASVAGPPSALPSSFSSPFRGAGKPPSVSNGRPSNREADEENEDDEDEEDYNDEEEHFPLGGGAARGSRGSRTNTSQSEGRPAKRARSLYQPYQQHPGSAERKADKAYLLASAAKARLARAASSSVAPPPPQQQVSSSSSSGGDGATGRTQPHPKNQNQMCTSSNDASGSIDEL